MRKLATIFASLLLLSVVIGMIGCNGGTESTPTPMPPTMPTPTPTSTVTLTPSPTPAPSCVINDDFSDGDFTTNPTWHMHLNQGYAPSPGRVDVADGDLHIVQSGAGGSGNDVGIYMDLNIPIAGKKATISFDVKSIYSTVRGGSGENGWNYPAMVVLDLQDTNGQQKGLWIGYSYRGGYSGVAPADPNIYILGHGNVPQDTWMRGESIVVQDYCPIASRITGISIRGDGWDYESRFDNICLKLESIPPTPNSPNTYTLATRDWKFFHLKLLKEWSGTGNKEFFFDVNPGPFVVDWGSSQTSQLGASFRMSGGSVISEKAFYEDFYSSEVGKTGYAVVNKSGHFKVQIESSGCSWRVRVGTE